MGSSLIFLMAAAAPASNPEQDVPARVEKLIQALKDESKEERDKAVAELVRIGRPALDALKKASTSSDSEVKALAAQSIEKIEWGGADRLRQYVKDHFDDGATVEVSKLKAAGKWFPDTRFYEVATPAAAGGAAAIMGVQGPRSVFAVRRYEEGFYRLLVKGISSPDSIKNLLGKQKIALRDSDSALDFAIAIMDLSGAGQNANFTAMALGGGASRLERTDEGWAVRSSGSYFLLKTDKDGALVDIVLSSNPYSMFGFPGASAEREKIEIEKFKLEVEVLKRQLEKKP